MSNDARALAFAAHVMQLVRGPALPGGDCQMKAKVQSAFLEFARMAETAPLPPSVGKGMRNEQWKLVPVEPTEELIYWIALCAHRGDSGREIWSEALACAPHPPSFGLGSDEDIVIAVMVGDLKPQWHQDPFEIEVGTELVDRAHVTALSAQLAASQARVAELEKALKFYADGEHYHFESENWDTVSGEPLNILWHGEEPDFIEDGSVAKAALAQQVTK